ncbi:MAG: aminotransferase class I/II-fold pyridoxal phosphate-dependent enzyme [Acidobacteriota bacterium]|nr:aminotransferase class I/II-fold pyridoxal phosphate-dependent enzyme [Acidobacteriota bacterium]
MSVDELNSTIDRDSPALGALLSDLGRRAIYPPDIPFQAAQARGAAFNATIGQITDGAGNIMAPASMTRLLALDPEARNRALLYSPMEGSAALRSAWRERQRPPGAPPSSLPTVLAGLTHGLSIVADLFGQQGRSIVIPAPFWSNYGQAFGLRRGVQLVPAPVYHPDGTRLEALADALRSLPPEEPALALINLPSNPVGYSLTVQERAEVIEILERAADERPLLVLCDDAYAGLVYEQDIPSESLFWSLADRHPQLVPVKVDGCTKEIVFFGGRVAFLTFPFKPESQLALAMESKAKCLVRATIGSPVGTSQELALATITAPALDEEIAEIRATLACRYQALRVALDSVDRELLRPLPFNSGCFALMELPDGIDPESLRQVLLRDYDTGVVAARPNYIRLAYCSVDEGAIPELVRRVEEGAKTLVAARSA